MKKIAIIMGLAAMAATSYGQGYVTVAGTFANSTNLTVITSAYTGGAVNTGTFGELGQTSTGQQYYLALLTTTASSPSTAFFGSANAMGAWTNTGTLGGNNGFAGRLVITSDYQVTDAAAGTDQNWILLAWSANLGSSLSTIMTDIGNGGGFSITGNLPGFVGWSVVGNGAAGAASPSQPLVVTGTPSPLISTGFTLEEVPTPEPATMALAAIGGASLLLFRRKK